MISEIFAASVFASSAKVVIPASLRVLAILGPIPSTFLRSSALEVAFFAALGAAAGAASFAGAAFFAGAFFSAFGADFLPPVAEMLEI